MIKFVDDIISIKAFKLEFEEFNDDSIGVFSVDGNKFKHYSLICYITTVAKSDNKYRYRDFEIFKNQDKWFIRSDKSGVISYKSNLEEALIYIDCIVAIMKNIEIANTVENCDINNENIISKYDDFVIFKNNDKYYYKKSNSKEVKEVVSKNFIEMIIEKDLAEGKHTNIVTRFPPEPNGYLHIGHAKSILLNCGLAKKYGGKFNLRFDDTNPTKEKTEFVESIKADVKWVGGDFEDRLFFASDYFGEMYEGAVKLIKKGKAFDDDILGFVEIWRIIDRLL